MAIPRRHLVDRDIPGFYHCTNRCVRRAFLCGTDKYSGKNYDHRKNWLKQRFLELCNIFAVDIYAYAIMDNHYHLVLYLDPKAPLNWTDEQVAERWLRAYPGLLDLPKNVVRRMLKKQEIIANKDKLMTYRKRLGDLSWFMGRLNEPLAKRSNHEDHCSGKFWEGRFSSQCLLDEAAVFACMAYVDLNPVRAKITQKLEESDHTSIQKRLENLQSKKNFATLDLALEAVIGQLNGKKLTLKLKDYIQLVDWTGRSIIYPDKASIPPDIPHIFDTFNLQIKNWRNQIKNYGKNYCNFVGSITNIRKKAKQLQLRSLHGVNSSREFYK